MVILKSIFKKYKFRMNSFFYGNPDDDQLTSKEFPLVAS